MTNQRSTMKLPKLLDFLIKLCQTILFILLQIIFIPFTIVGLILGFYKEMAGSKKLGVSYSAGQALQYRWFMHYFNTRPDPISVEFIKKFPCESHFGLWTTMGALIISQRVFGFKTRLSKLVKPGEENLDSTAGIRVLTFDRILEEHIDEMEQIVLPGVGFDLVALHFTKGKKIKVFELDQVNTINVKVDTLKKAGIKHDWISYIPVDYSSDSWTDKLIEAGFDRTKRTLFLWQSVSHFLEEDIVRLTIKEMADLCTDGSIIAQDFYSAAFVSGKYSKLAKRNMGMIEKMGEPMKFGINMSGEPKSKVNSFLNECGLKMTEYIQFGEKLDIEPFYCIVKAEKL